MEIKDYKPRIIDKKVDEYLELFGAICIEGPKWCGKTWTSKTHSNSSIFLADPTNNFQNKKLAEMSPDLVLSGKHPRLIDEWQEVPSIWDAVRYAVDKDVVKGKFILTGSSTPNQKGILHSGAGRIARLRMRPMSLYESGDSTGDVSLELLCQGSIREKLTGDVDLRRIASLIVRGGFPGTINAKKEKANLINEEYINAIVEDDSSRIDGKKRSKLKLNLLLKSLARNESTTVSIKTIVKDINNNDQIEINENTVSDYLNVFDRLFLTDNQSPFSPSIRSSVRVKQLSKRHLADPSLSCAILKLTEDGLINDLNTFGFMFESMCERDLRIYAESFDANLYHYQDYQGREVDAIIEMKNGKWCAFEIKLGANQIDEAAEKLIMLSNSFEPASKPSILCVICGLSNATYKRPDGVFVVPITALKM